MPLHCTIVSQDRMVFDGEADIVIVPGVEGEMGILPHHAPLISTLRFGILRVRSGGNEDVFAVGGGLVEVAHNQVNVLADTAENVQEIDIARAEAAKQRAEQILKEGPPPDEDAYLAIERSLRKSNLRLEAAQKYRRQRPPHSGGMGG